jgi:hypothetical protein
LHVQHDPAGELLVHRLRGVAPQAGYVGLVREGQRARRRPGLRRRLLRRAPLRVGEHAVEHIEVVELALKKQQDRERSRSRSRISPTPPRIFSTALEHRARAFWVNHASNHVQETRAAPATAGTEVRHLRWAGPARGDLGQHRRRHGAKDFDRAVSGQLETTARLDGMTAGRRNGDAGRCSGGLTSTADGAPLGRRLEAPDQPRHLIHAGA